MGFEAEFADLMHDTVTIRPYTGLDAYGTKTLGDPVTYQARVVGRTRVVTSTQGDEKISTVTTLLLNSAGINPLSEITLPPGFDPQTPPIIAVLRDRDDLGRITETIYT